MFDFSMLLVGLIVAALFIVPFWRILGRTGLPAPLALLLLVPMIGGLLLLAVLAFARWPAFDGSSREVRP